MLITVHAEFPAYHRVDKRSTKCLIFQSSSHKVALGVMQCLGHNHCSGGHMNRKRNAKRSI